LHICKPQRGKDLGPAGPAALWVGKYFLVFRDSWMVNVNRFIQIIGQISRLRCASLEMTTKWIPARHPTCSTIVENPRQRRVNLYKSALFMQNKANLRNVQMNISSFIASKYERLDIWWIGKNKPNSKPISRQTTENRIQKTGVRISG
jgi:hypothetical protein